MGKGNKKKSKAAVADEEDQTMEAEPTTEPKGNAEEEAFSSAEEMDEDEMESEKGENEGEDGEDGEDETFYDNVEGLERLNFDFEAFPPDDSDVEGILDLLTQIFLRVNVDCEELAKNVVGLSPFGCVFRPAEENEDDEVGSLVYGVVSMLDLLKDEKCFRKVREFLSQRAAKHADKAVAHAFADVFAGGSKRLGFLVNERMIHFPPQIAGPAFRSLSADLAALPNKRQYDAVLMIVKMRIGDAPKNGGAGDALTGESAGSSSAANKKRGGKLGKAAKKRLAAERITAADVIFDNAEEELLFQAISTPFPYFQYPVESDVEKTSKFHGTVRDNIVYRPYRRVCLLSGEQFTEFTRQVETTFSP